MSYVKLIGFLRILLGIIALVVSLEVGQINIIYKGIVNTNCLASIEKRRVCNVLCIIKNRVCQLGYGVNIILFIIL